MVPPSHVPATTLGVETINPAGSVSRNAIPVSAVVFGLETVKLNAVVFPGPNSCNWESANALVIVGGETTVTVAVAAAPTTPSASVSVLVTLFWMPAAIPVTFRLIVQDAPGARLPPAWLIVPGEVALTIPPQLLAKPLGNAIAKPAGRVSVKLRLVNGVGFPAGFVSVNVNVVELPT